MLSTLVVVVMLVVLAACGDEPSVVAGDDGDAATGLSLAGTWELTELVVDDGIVELPDPPPTITIETGMIDGNGGCNRFSGPINRGDDGSLTVGPLSQTEMACEVLDFEAVYVGALASATAWEGSPDGITFVSGNATIAYRPHTEAPVVEASLFETRWLLDTVYGPGTGPERAISTVDMSAADVELTLTATTATLVSDPCSDAVYDISLEEGGGGGSLEVLGGGSFLCEGSEGANANHDTASSGLVGATGYLLDGNRLILIGEEGELVGFAAAIEGS